MFVADYLSIFYLVSKIFDELIFYEILTDSGNILEETEKLIVISYNNCKNNKYVTLSLTKIQNYHFLATDSVITFHLHG